MKATSIVALFVVGVLSTDALGLTPSQANRAKATVLAGWFDFKPVHGSGSAKEQDLDEIWEAQQAILRERRGHLSKRII